MKRDELVAHALLCVAKTCWSELLIFDYASLFQLSKLIRDVLLTDSKVRMWIRWSCMCLTYKHACTLESRVQILCTTIPNITFKRSTCCFRQKGRYRRGREAIVISLQCLYWNIISKVWSTSPHVPNTYLTLQFNLLESYLDRLLTYR